MFPAPPNVAMSPQQSFIVAHMRDFGRLYCVYEHHDADDNLLYIGVCKLIEVFSFPDARQNSEWIKRFPADSVVIIKITMTSPDINVCNNARHRQMLSLRPICNVLGFSYVGMKLKIICNETGEEFESVSEAARAHNLTQSHLSNHLNQKAGHRSVKGRTYRKGS